MTAGRILYVTDGFAPFVVGGMQTYARRQLETLAAAGRDVISVSSREAEPVGDLPWRNISLPWPARSGIGRFSPWRYVGDLKRFSVAVSAIIDEVQPALIYAEGPLIHDYLHRAHRPAPAIFNPHGLEMFQRKGSLAEDLKSWPLRGIVADHARRADRTVSLSDGGQLQRILQGIGVPDARIALLPNAAPDTVAQPRTGQSGKARFLFVGRDEPRKALPLLVEAFRGIEGAELDVVGAEALPGAPANIRFHGMVRDRKRVRAFYAGADFLAAPSHAEGMPTVILESFAAAMPVIATDVGGNAGLVRSGETGFLIPRADKVALQKAIRDAIAMPDADYARQSAACLDMAQTLFSAHNVGRKLLTLLDAMLGTNKSE